MHPANPASGGLSVSVIIPARNEEASLGACLESLTRQTGVSFEIIVVDDGSTDRTAEIAHSFAGVQVIQPGPLPAGWTGKNNAVTAGAGQARAKWLLFTDADTVHLPDSLASSLAEAKRRNVDLLSYSPEQEVHGFWEKAVMPVIFAELASTFRPSLVSDPKSPAAAANGQYILISRDAYRAVGGHAAIATSLLEDVALARAVKSSGKRIFFRLGRGMVRTRMYRSLAQLVEGWSKNLTLLFHAPVRLAILRMLEFVLIVAAAAVAIFGVARAAKFEMFASGIVFLVFYGSFLVRIRKAHFHWDASLLSIFGLPVFSYLLLRSQISYKRGAVTWKGRTYAGETHQVMAVPPERSKAQLHQTAI